MLFLIEPLCKHSHVKFILSNKTLFEETFYLNMYICFILWPHELWYHGKTLQLFYTLEIFH